MKKVIFVLIIISAISCKNDESEQMKCATCTEQATQVKSTYCGTIDAVNVFKTTLIHDGAAIGQTWNCKDN